MLRDRATPLGGWNAGNGVAFDVPLRPHLDTTAVALLALQNKGDEQLAQTAFAFLGADARTDIGAHGLAWALLCLNAYEASADQRHLVARRLCKTVDVRAGSLDVATLALSLIALSVEDGATSPFEVPR